MRLGRLSTNTYQCAYITTESACEQCPPSYQGLPLYDEMVTPRGESPSMWSPCGSSSSQNPPDWHLDVWLKSKGPDYWWCVKEKEPPSPSYEPCRSVLLLMHFDGEFKDSSTNSFEVYPDGVTISSDQSKFGGSSGYFDGSSFVRTQDSSIIDLRTDDFTVEAWIKTSSADEQVVVSMWDCNRAQFLMKVNNYQAMVQWLDDYGYVIEHRGGSITPGQWTHYAFTREGNVLRAFLNGTQVITFTSTSSWQSPTTAVQIGKESNCYSANWFVGYIDELRIIRGFALYKAEFEKPTSPFDDPINISSSSSSSSNQYFCVKQSDINNDIHEICGGPYLEKSECETELCVPNTTQLLVHFDETSTKDNEAILYLDFEDGLKNNGTEELCIRMDESYPARIVGADDNLPSNSAYFNGSSYLTVPFSDDFAFENSDFTVEAWVYWEELGRQGYVIASGTQDSQIVWGLKLVNIEDYYYYETKGVYWKTPSFQLSANYEFETNNWYHIAACRTSGTLRLFVNGELLTSGSDTTNYLPVGYGEQHSVSIGKMQVWNWWWWSFEDQFFKGYMDEIRVLKGTSLYPSNFTPLADPSATNSSLMLRFNEPEGNSKFFDSSQNKCSVKTNGNVVATRGPGKFKYGRKSTALPGSINVKTNPSLSLGTEDFTIETWAYLKSWGNGYPTLYDGLQINGSYYRSNCFCWALLQNSNNNTSGVYYNGQWHNFDVSVPIPLNSWMHHALVRKDGVLYWYMNGKFLGTIPFSLNCTSPNCVIGRASDQQTNFFYGYIDDYKITKSAKYENAIFTPPQSAFEGDFQQYPYSLLMHFDGSFSYLSSRNLSVSVNGSAEISSFESKFGGYSANFTGNYDSVIVSNPRFVKFEYKDFTIECWIKIDYTQNYYQYIFQGPQGYLYYYGGLYHSSLPSYSLPMSNNEWHHVALVRKNLITSLYIDGSLSSSGIDEGNYNGSSFYIGSGQYGYGTIGYIDEFRILNGEAAYEGTINVPNESFLNDLTSQPSLVLYFEGNFNDNSTNQLSVSVYGNATTTTSQFKWGGNSAYFPEDNYVYASSYIDVINSNNALQFGSQDFTIECWFYPTTYNSTSGYQAIFSGREDFTYGVMMDEYGYLAFWASSVGWYWNLSNTYGYDNYQVSLDSWNHVAVVRKNNVFSLYLNGKNVAQRSVSSGTVLNSGSGIRIGAWGNGAYGINNGYIDEFRVVKGQALYTCGFDPPQSGFYESSSSSSSSSSFDPTSLMLHMDESVRDESALATKITLNGNVEVSTITSKFGQGSAYFDGNSYISIPPNSQSLSFGNQDFTIEFWMYSTRNYQEKIISTQGSGFFLQKKYGNKLELAINGTGYITQYPVVTQNSWLHVAISREDGVFRLFVSGDLVMEVTSEMAFSIPNILNIGKDTSYIYQYPFEGYLDEIRATKGVALYSQSFPEPSQAFTTSVKSEISQKISLLMHFNGQDQSINFVDSGPNRLIFNEGNYNYARIKTSKSVFGGSSGFFDGNSYLTTASSGFDFGSGDFTIESWVYLEQNLQDNFILGSPDNSSWYFGFNQSNQFGLGFGRRGVGWDIVDTSGPFPVGVWRHVAACRKDGVIRLFVNGQKVAESSSSISYSNQSISIGGGWNYGNMNGYLDEVRIIKDLGVYENNFATPSEQYVEANWDVVLLHFDGEDGSTKFVNSASNIVVSNVANASISTEKSKFGQSSAKFNGNGDRIDLEESKLLFLENEDYTVECFVYITDWSGTNHARIWSFQYEYYYFYENWSLLVMNNGTGALYLNKLGTSEGIMTPPGVVSLNQWIHIALTREGNVRYLYVDGKMVGSYGQRCLPDPTNRQAFCRLSLGGSVGTFYGYYSYSNFKGYIDEFRVTKGLARYKNQNISIGPSPEQTIIDSSPNKLAIKANGIEITPTQSKFGGNSGYFSGSEDFLEVDSPNLVLGKGDFTIEFWIRPISYPKSGILVTGHKAGDPYNSGFMLGPSNFNGGLRLSDDYNNDILSYESCLVLNEWRHIAIVRHNNYIKLYVSGNMVSSSYSNDDFTSGKLIVGMNPSVPSLSFNGYIDDLRVVTAAVYKSNFDPPGSQSSNYLPIIGNQVYCISLIDYDANIHEICGGPYYSKDQCGSCIPSSSSSGSSSSSSSAELVCFPIVSIVDMPDGSKSVNVECSNQPPSSSSSFCIPEVPPSEDITCPDGRIVGKTYYLPNFTECSWVVYHDIYGACDSSSSSSSSSSNCQDQVRHCLYSDFSIGASLFALEDKPPPCTYRTYCLPEGCVEICETTEGATPIASCDPGCCKPGYCLLDCSTSVSVSNCIACGLLGGMWFSSAKLLEAYLDQNCKIECWQCSQDENNECSPITITDQYKYPKDWTWTGQKEITCDDLGYYSEEGACTDDCCDCYCGGSSCANTSHKTIEELASDCGDCCASSGGGIILQG